MREMGQTRTRCRADMPQRVAAGIAVGGSIGLRADADPVKHDRYEERHEEGGLSVIR